MLDTVVDHLIHNVIPAAADYHAAEHALTEAYRADPDPQAWEAAARTVKRKAADAAIAIDGLTDRCAIEQGRSKSSIRTDLSALCRWPGTGAPRLDAHDRVRSVAAAYKHKDLHDPTLRITSDSDVLVVGLGWGLDGWGVGKYGGVEMLVQETAGGRFKFLGDVPVAVAAWFSFLAANGATLPSGPLHCCNLQIHP